MRLKNKYYTELRKKLTDRYPTVPAIQAVINGADMNVGHFRFDGTGEEIWDYALSRIQQNNKVDSIIRYAVDHQGADEVFDEVLAGIENGEALLQKTSFESIVAPENNDAPVVFLIYDGNDDDIKMAKKMRNHLFPLQAIGKARIQRLEEFGGKQESEVHAAIGSARIVLLLITPDFIGSDNDRCLKLAYAAYDQRRRLVPVLVRNCLYNRISILDNIVPLPPNGDFIAEAINLDRALMEIAKSVQELLITPGL